MRRARTSDAECVWRWNSAPDVRAQSNDPRPIRAIDHVAWYSRRLTSADPMWIIEDTGVRVGVVRIDRRDGKAWISIALAEEARGRGIGRFAITTACRELGTTVFAEIHHSNSRSRACFERCGFTQFSSSDTRAVLCWRPEASMSQLDSRDTEQLRLWRSDFGRAYTDRNSTPRPERIEAWRRVLDGIPHGSALEVGCNVGWNLTYLRELGWSDLHGVEPQAYAVARARERAPELDILQGDAFALPFVEASMDLVFTSGVLIHIAPESLGGALDEIFRVSRRWIVAIEYDAAGEVEVLYRGERHALWKRDHGAMWQARFPQLSLVRRIELGEAYDNCTAHVFEKTA